MLVDANLLLYPHVAPFPHARAHEWLDERINAAARYACPGPASLAFARFFAPAGEEPRKNRAGRAASHDAASRAVYHAQAGNPGEAAALPAGVGTVDAAVANRSFPYRLSSDPRRHLPEPHLRTTSTVLPDEFSDERLVLQLRQPRPKRDEGSLRAPDRPRSGMCHREDPLAPAPLR